MRRLTALAFVASVAATPACSEETIVLATVAADDAGVRPNAQRCSRNEECPPDAYCDKATCDAPAGTCRRRPTLCAPEERATCGCNGITYLNDCLRRAAGISAAELGECDATALRCSAATACPEGAMCALLAPTRDTCTPEMPGVCWVVPSICPPPQSPDRWEACMPGGPRCVGTCDAIQQGTPFHRAGRCL